MLAWWSSVAVPTEFEKNASDLVLFVMQNSYHERSNIFKYNMELIKLIFETWKNHIEIPYDFIDKTLKENKENKGNHLGVHLMAIALANGVAPWQANTFAKVLKDLCETMINKKQSQLVYNQCSEVVGMALAFMRERPEYHVSMQKFIGALHNKYLEKIIEDNNKFAYCLKAITQHYPSIADQYLASLIDKVKFAQGSFKGVYLDIILRRVDYLCEIGELSTLNFNSLLNDGNLDVQAIALEIINSAIAHFSFAELKAILCDITKYIQNPNVTFRMLTFNIFITTYNLYKENESYSDIISICKGPLIQGIIDNELEIQRKLLNFWSDRTNLPTSASERLLKLLDCLYKTDTEEHFVGYSSYLLLDILNSTEDFHENIFDRQLHVCDYKSYELTSSWRHQHSSIVPIFAETYSSQGANYAPLKRGVLRATQSYYAFQPTAASVSLDDNKPHLYRTSSLSVSLDADQPQSVQNNVFKDPNLVLPDKYSRFGKRFLRDSGKVSAHMANVVVKGMIRGDQQRKERVKKQEASVTIYRKYRIGDFPDIEIPLSSLLTPLQILARVSTICHMSD